MIRQFDYVTRVLLLALVHVATGMLALSLHTVGELVSLLWAPSAIGLAIVLLYGRRWWPGVALGSFTLASVRGFDIGPSLVIAMAAALEVLLGFTLLRALRFRPELDRVRDVVTFISVAVFISLLSATAGIAALHWSQVNPFMHFTHVWRTWWWSHLSSDVILGPVILTFGRKSVSPRIRARRIEGVILASVGLVLVLLVMGRFLDRWIPESSSPYALLPVLIWSGVRFGPRGAALAGFGASTFAIIAQSVGLGPFDRVVDMQSFITISTMSTLALSALTSERLHAVERMGGIEVVALDAIVTIDQNARILELNPAAEELFGLRGAVGKDLTKLVVPHRLVETFRTRLRDYVRRGVGRGVRFRTVAMHATKKTEIPVEVAVAPYQAIGAPAFTGFIRDISVEVNAKEALERQVAERTADLVEMNNKLERKGLLMRQAENLAHIGSFDYDTVTGSLRWSDELYRIYGREPGLFVPTFEALMAAVHSDDRHTMNETIEKAIANVQPFSLVERIVRPSGETRVLQTTGRVLASKTGEACRILGCCQDITERAEREEQGARLAELVKSSEDAIIGLSPNGEIETWNEAARKIFGYDGKEVIGRMCTMLVPDSVRPRMRDLIDAVRSGEHLAHYEMTHMRKDGTLFEASVATSAVMDPRDVVVGLSKVIRDVTNERQVEAQMRASLREKEVLLREIHHRVKNNLQVIASLLNLQMAGEANTASHKGLIESQNRIHSMALVHQLLYQSKDLARIEFGEYLKKVTRRLVDTYSVDEHLVTVDVTSTPMRLDIDHAIPCGLLVNELVTNALTHAFPDGRAGHVWITQETEGDKIILTVADDGVGIPDNLNIDDVQTFGLRIARTLTAQLEGTLTLSREHGTRARVVFPMPGEEARE